MKYPAKLAITISVTSANLAMFLVAVFGGEALPFVVGCDIDACDLQLAEAVGVTYLEVPARPLIGDVICCRSQPGARSVLGDKISTWLRNSSLTRSLW